MTYQAGDCIDGNEVLSGPFRLLPKGRRITFYMTRCQVCGLERAQRGCDVASKPKCSYCGKKKTHGKARKGAIHPDYSIWCGMRSRCQRPGDSNYWRYGASGITVDQRWDSFENFLRDMGPRPSKRHSIDRIDGTKGYGPDNCRWATPQLQQRNRCNNVILFYMNRGWNYHELASHIGMNAATLTTRISALKWPVERAVSTPVGRKIDDGAQVIADDKNEVITAAAAAIKE